MPSDNPETNLEMAERLCERGFAKLETPDSIKTVSRIELPIDSELRLEIRVTANIGRFLDPFRDEQILRYLYVWGPHSPEDSWDGVLFSVDLDSLSSDEGFSGLVDDKWRLPEIAERAEGDIAELIGYVRRVLVDEDRPLGFSPGDRQLSASIDGLFCGILADGATTTRKRWSNSDDDGLVLTLQSEEFDGPVEHAWSIDLEGDQIKILAKIDGGESDIVLVRNCEGVYESYQQLSHPFKRIAAYTDPENIIRNDDGEVVAIMGSYFNEKLVAEAERAAGMRNLQSRYLNFIAHCMDSCLGDEPTR